MHGSSIVALVGSLLWRRARCSASVFAHNGVARSAEKVRDTGISDGWSSPRLDVYGQTLQEIDPELSTFNVERHEGQNGHGIIQLLYRRINLRLLGLSPLEHNEINRVLWKTQLCRILQKKKKSEWLRFRINRMSQLPFESQSNRN